MTSSINAASITSGIHVEIISRVSQEIDIQGVCVPCKSFKLKTKIQGLEILRKVSWVIKNLESSWLFSFSERTKQRKLEQIWQWSYEPELLVSHSNNIFNSGLHPGKIGVVLEGPNGPVVSEDEHSQTCGLKTIMRSPKVPSHETLGAQHLAYMKKVSFPVSQRQNLVACGI